VRTASAFQRGYLDETKYVATTVCLSSGVVGETDGRPVAALIVVRAADHLFRAIAKQIEKTVAG
jgi:hypothetical protein